MLTERDVRLGHCKLLHLEHQVHPGWLRYMGPVLKLMIYKLKIIKLKSKQSVGAFPPSEKAQIILFTGRFLFGLEWLILLPNGLFWSTTKFWKGDNVKF